MITDHPILDFNNINENPITLANEEDDLNNIFIAQPNINNRVDNDQFNNIIVDNSNNNNNDDDHCVNSDGVHGGSGVSDEEGDEEGDREEQHLLEEKVLVDLVNNSDDNNNNSNSNLKNHSFSKTYNHHHHHHHHHGNHLGDQEMGTHLDSEESSDTSGDISISYEFSNISTPIPAGISSSSSNDIKSPINFLNEPSDNHSSSNSTPVVEPSKGFYTNTSPRSSKKLLGNSMTNIALESTWLMILNNVGEWGDSQFQSILTKYIYQGIPDRFRPSVWFHLSNLIEEKSPIPTCNNLILNYTGSSTMTSSSFTPISTPATSTPTIKGNGSSSNITTSINTSPNSSPSGSTLSLSTPHSSLKVHKCFYQSIIRHSSEHEEQIRVDIQRSFPDVEDPELKEYYSTSLFNVLKAISLYDPEMGYCQGISFVGSVLITKLNEEEVFHVLIRLVEGVMRDFYIVGMRGLKLRIYQLGKFVNQLFPKLYAHLQKIDLDYMIFASPWFLTAFSYHLTEECSIRVLDVILLQGINGFFSIALAVFQIIEEDLLNCSDASEAMEFFRNNAKSKIEVAQLMDTSSRITIQTHQLQTYANQFENEPLKHSIPSEFNPEDIPKERVKDPKWVVKKYKLMERISNLEHDLAVTKHELHSKSEKLEEDKEIFLKHGKQTSDYVNELKSENLSLLKQIEQLKNENQSLKKDVEGGKEIHLFLTKELNTLRSKLEKELWKNNPKKSIQFE